MINVFLRLVNLLEYVRFKNIFGLLFKFGPENKECRLSVHSRINTIRLSP